MMFYLKQQNATTIFNTILCLMTTLVFFLISCFNTVEAKNLKESVLHQEFQYNGNFISPQCISEIYRDESSMVNLEACTKNQPAILEDGFIGFNVEPKQIYQKTCLDKYKYVGKYKNYHIIYVIVSDGFTFPWSSVFLVERSGNILKNIKIIIPEAELLPYSSSGSVSKINLNNGKLIYDLNITLLDYIRLSGVNVPEIKMDKLSNVNQGTAHYESDFENTRFVSINIGELIDINKIPKRRIYDKCFWTLLNDYKKQGKKILNPDDLRTLIERFSTKCMK